MTVYKAIKKEADAASKLAIALAKGDTAGADALATGSVEDTETKQQVKRVLLQPQAIFPENVKDVVADGFTTADKICTSGGAQEGLRGATASADDKPLPGTAARRCCPCGGSTRASAPSTSSADVDFDVRPGEVTALVGDNGAGKSTLIKCVAGIHPFDSGEMVFEGRRSRSTVRRTRTRSGSRSSIRTSRCATTSTSCTTCSSGVR